MTSAIAFPCHIVGLMSGTSADGVDAALLYTDGKTIAKPGPTVFVPYEEHLRQGILTLMRGQGPIDAIAHALTQVHIEAVQALMKKTGMSAQDIGLIGFHGQTIYHAPHLGVTVQIGAPAEMAKALGIPVIADFRSNDVRNGGQGAPLVPFYHVALAQALPKPLMVVNIGGVANVTWIGENDQILAFDCGPGNALMDDWVHQHEGARYDKNGEIAARGTVDEAIVAQFMNDEFFHRPAPKSLDRHHFSSIIPRLSEGACNVADGTATLTALTAAAISKACTIVPAKPKQLLITGGGRRNPTLMRMIEAYAECKSPVAPIESVGWDGDMLEAEAFAYLAARSAQGLPLSMPSTTGVAQPVTGGVFYPGESVDAF